jgi:cellulose synthase/poly-beta-1,6-N-acetylglucosamine synthase-like glycosyltransferase
VDPLTVALGAAAAACLPPLVDALGRYRRASSPSPPPPPGKRPARVLALIPARAEGTRMLPLCRDVRREGDAAGVALDVCVVLDGGDAAVAEALAAEGFSPLVKTPAGPAKGAVLAFATERLDADGRIGAADFVLVFDADMRLADGFFRDLAVPEACDAFQLPVRAAGAPAPGAARVEALSLAAALVDDLLRDEAGLPVRLRGKAMGFSPRAWRLGPAAAFLTTAEDSEATLALAAAGLRVRALPAPCAFDEPAADAAAMAASRARWLGGQTKLLVTGLPKLLALAARSPRGAFVLAADVFLRPRAFVWLFLVAAALFADVALVVLAMTFRVSSPAFTLAALLSAAAKSALVAEVMTLGAVRSRIGTPPEVPAVAFSDLRAALGVWLWAAVAALKAPSRWHRARPAE